jgi:hypothetical protein
MTGTGLMQKFLNYVTAGGLLVCSVAPLSIFFRIIPSYVANPDIGVAWYAVCVAVFLILAGAFLIATRMNLRNPPANFTPPSRGKAVMSSVVVLIVYAAFVPLTILGGLPALATLVWHAPQTFVMAVARADGSAGRKSCAGRVDLKGIFMLSSICGVPEDMRSMMKPGDRVEIAGVGHAMGMRVETVRQLPAE